MAACSIVASLGRTGHVGLVAQRALSNFASPLTASGPLCADFAGITRTPATRARARALGRPRNLDHAFEKTRREGSGSCRRPHCFSSFPDDRLGRQAAEIVSGAE